MNHRITIALILLLFSLRTTALDFCGEPIPLNRQEVWSRYELIRGKLLDKNSIQYLVANAYKYMGIVESILRKNNIPDDFKYLPIIESNYTYNIVSPAGAVGFWQIMDETAVLFGAKNINTIYDERLDIYQSTELACKILNYLYQETGSWILAAAAYNGGIGTILKQIKKGYDDYFSMSLVEETASYVFKIAIVKDWIIEYQNSNGVVENEKNILVKKNTKIQFNSFTFESDKPSYDDDILDTISVLYVGMKKERGIVSAIYYRFKNTVTVLSMDTKNRYVKKNGDMMLSLEVGGVLYKASLNILRLRPAEEIMFFLSQE